MPTPKRYNDRPMERSPVVPSDDSLIPPLCAIFRRSLKQQGLKFTPERAMILDAVLSKKAVFEADELLFEMRRQGHRVSKATIYRTLKHLLDAKIITEVLIDPKLSHYQLSFGREPKGHLVCVETNRVIEFTSAEVVELRDRIAREHGYEPVSFRFVIYGISPEAKKTSG
jgi:Fur family transcriptional regulator, ferric uptake regulator